MSRIPSSKNRNHPGEATTLAAVSRPLTLGDRIFLKLGPQGARAIKLSTALVLFALVMLLDYLIVLFTAVNVLPNIAALIQQGTGVTLEARLDMVIAGWLIPVLFIVAAVLVAEIFLMRRLWRLASFLSQAVGRSLFRMSTEAEEALVQEADTSPTARPKRGKSAGAIIATP